MDRFLTLASWGFNVPRFVLNPVQNYGRDTYVYMKQEFERTEPFDILCTRKDMEKTVYRESVRLSDAVLTLAQLESSNYDALLLEYIEPDWDARILLESEHHGKVFINKRGGRQRAMLFASLHNIEDLVLRHAVRECVRIKKRLEDKFVLVDVRWSTDFLGVLGSRLVFRDFRYK